MISSTRFTVKGDTFQDVERNAEEIIREFYGDDAQYVRLEFESQLKQIRSASSDVTLIPFYVHEVTATYRGRSAPPIPVGPAGRGILRIAEDRLGDLLAATDK